MELSPEEKQRIYLEEKARLEAQEKVKKEIANKKTERAVVGCLGVFGGLFLLIVVAALCGSQTESSSGPVQSASAPIAHRAPKAGRPPRPPDDDTGRLVLLPGYKGEIGEFGTLTVRGKVANKMGRDLTYAQIQFNLYDKHGAQVGTALANINHLEAGGIWRFEAVGFGSEGACRFKLAELTGF